MWALVIVKPHPLRGYVLYVIQTLPLELREPFVAGCSVEPFNACILLRLAGLDVFKLDLLSDAYWVTALLRYSGPLSHWMRLGLPRQRVCSRFKRGEGGGRFSVQRREKRSLLLQMSDE